MAGAASRSEGSKAAKLTAELKERIGIVVASEGGKIDASFIRKKYAFEFGKEIPKKTKIANFVKEHMSDDFEVIQERSTTFIKSKTKRKDAKNVQLSRGKAMNKVGTKSKLVPDQIHSTTNTFDNESDTVSVSMDTVSAPDIMFTSAQPTNRQPLNTSYENNFPSLNAASHPNKPVTDPSMQYKPQHNPKRINKTNIHVDMTTKGISGVKDTEVKNEVDRIIDELSKDNYVEVDLVTKRLFERFKVPNEKKLGNYRRVDDIPGIRELLRKQREVRGRIVNKMLCIKMVV